MFFCRFGGLEVTSWSNFSQQVIPVKCWSIAQSLNCSEVFTSSTKEGEVSLWDLSTQSRTDVFWPAKTRPFTYVVYFFKIYETNKLILYLE